MSFMVHFHRLGAPLGAALLALAGCAAQSPAAPPVQPAPQSAPAALSSAALGTADATLRRTEQLMLGHWASVATEVRASGQVGADGRQLPIYLERDFKFLPAGRFELTVTGFVDAYGQQPTVRLLTRGHVVWRGAHPIAPGAQKVDFLVDEAYDVTPLAQGFADSINAQALPGYAKWEMGRTQSVFGKDFAPFGLKAGQIVTEHELVYVKNGMLFWGARHVDGRGFDTDANRPTNLQVPLVRK
jgi:hypothetical protein